MTGFLTRTSTHLGVDRIFTSVTATALYENLFAVLQKDASAVSAGAVLANSYVVEAMVNAGAISQSKLKATSGEVSRSGPAGAGNSTLPGGAYGFYPQVKYVNSGGDGNAVDASIALNQTSTSYISSIYMDTNGTTVNDFVFAQQVYIQASPPYDLGNGAVPLFVFALVDSLGRIAATYSAEDPPWANNGPTNIRADFYDKDGRAFQVCRPRVNRAALLDPALRDAALEKLAEGPRVIEVTQALKQADMPLIPHPFIGNDLAGMTVVMLDPLSTLVAKLHEIQRSGESVCSLLHEGYVKVDNSALSAVAPPGTMPVAVNWEATKA